MIAGRQRFRPAELFEDGQHRRFVGIFEVGDIARLQLVLDQRADFGLDVAPLAHGERAAHCVDVAIDPFLRIHDSASFPMPSRANVATRLFHSSTNWPSVALPTTLSR